MVKSNVMTLLLAVGLILTAQEVSRQTPTNTEADTSAINTLYRQWSEATATRGAEGYVSFFTADGAVLPPNAPAAEGREAIRKWIQTSLDESTVEVASFVPGPMQVADRMAFRRFTMTGKRVPKKGGAPVPFNYKYLDILQKQPDGSWKFVSRMWNSNDDK